MRVRNWRFRRTNKVAKTQSTRFWIKMRVCLLKGMWIQLQSLSIRCLDSLRFLWLWPVRQAPESTFERANRSHRDCIDHLLMKLRIPVRWGQAILGQNVWTIKVDGLAQESSFVVFVNDL